MLTWYKRIKGKSLKEMEGWLIKSHIEMGEGVGTMYRSLQDMLSVQI